MKNKAYFLILVVFLLLNLSLFGQTKNSIDSIEKKIILNRDTTNEIFGYNCFTAKICNNNQKYILIFCDDKNKKTIDSVDIVNLITKGGQSINAHSYPFQNSSLIFLIEKNICLYINKINPFDSAVSVKIRKCPETGVADTLITEIPDISVTDYFTGKQINLKKYISENKGDKIAVYFWDSSCSYCVEELSLLKELKKRGYLVISFCSSLSVKEEVQEFVSKFDLKDPLFIGGNDIVGDAFNQGGFPQIILFEPNEKYPIYSRSIEAALEYVTDLKNKTK